MAITVSLVCAPPHVNPGMYSVDFAFQHFLERSKLAVDFKRYCIGGSHRAAGILNDSLEYSSLDDSFEEALAADAIVYWGDFHHARCYWSYALRGIIRRRQGIESDAEIYRYLSRYLLLSDADRSILDKTLSFGTTIIGDESTGVGDEFYAAPFERFVSNIRGIWFRDPISAARAAALRGPSPYSVLGTDCALLTRREEYLSRANGAPRLAAPYACIHFGRLQADLRPALKFASRFAARAGLVPSWLPWLTPTPDTRRVAQRHVRKLLWDIEEPAYEVLLDRLAGAELVITDTYHLCLIAWRLGVPAVCIGSGAQRPRRPISDKKKEVFYLAYGLSQYYLYYEELSARKRVERRMDEMLETLRLDEVTQRVTSTIDAHTQRSERELHTALAGLG